MCAVVVRGVERSVGSVRFCGDVGSLFVGGDLGGLMVVSGSVVVGDFPGG